MKENKILKFTIFTLFVSIIAIILVSSTYAKYASTASGTDATVIAKWSFKVNGTDITTLGDNENVTFGLFDTIYDSDGINEETDVKEGLIAPGTSGAFEFNLENSSDVTTRYAIKLSIDNENVPLEFSIDGDTWTTDLENLVASDIIAINGTKNVTVKWRWAFGENEITDASLGGQEITVTASVTAAQVDNSDIVEVNALEGKSAIFFGDSVAYGHQTNGNGFGYYVDNIVNLSNYTNAAVNSAALNTETQGENNVIEQIKKNASTSYDFVILQGGFGDLRDEPPIGTLTDGYVVSELDTTTFAGAVEYTLYLTTTTWENSKIGFIISYDAPNSNAGVRPDHNASKGYWDIVKAACDKWNVSYLDFFEGSTTYNGETKTYSELFDVTGNTYIATDGVHPTATGYEFIVPFIVDWMKTLSVYERDFEIITDNTSSDEPEGYTIVSNFTDLVFTKDISPSRLGNGYSETPNWGQGTYTSTGRATAVNYLVKVNGGETIGLSDRATGVTYAVGEVDSNAIGINLEMVVGNGQFHGEWLSNDLTLTDNTRYIMVSFKNGDGNTSFTDDQIALLPTYIEFK